MPEETFETPQPTQAVTEPKLTNWPKIVLIAVLGLGLLAAAAYAGYWYGTQQARQTQPSKDVSPTPSPADTLRGEIVFVRDGDIWMVNGDGTEQINLGIQGEWPLLSPDKKWVAFIKDGDLFKAAIDDREKIRLTSHGLKDTSSTWSVSVTAPKWSPNGDFISYTLVIQRCVGLCEEEKQDPGGINEGIWVVDISSKETKFLVPKTEEVIHEVYSAWLPSSEALVFKADGVAHTVGIESGQIEKFDIEYGSGFSWSRNGERMVYYTLINSVLDKIYVVKDGESNAVFDNASEQQISYDDTTVNQPLISPDGDKLFFENGPNSLGDPYSFAVMDLNNGVITPLDLGLKDFGLFLRGWSEDSTRLVFDAQQSVPGGMQVSIWAINFDGTGLKQIVVPH